MNGTYYPNPNFLENNNDIKENEIISLDKDIFNKNKGKYINIYLEFKNKDKEFEGRIEYQNDDYLILSDITNNKYILIPIKYIRYAIFDESLKI